MSDVKGWFKENPVLKTKITSEKRKFMEMREKYFPNLEKMTWKEEYDYDTRVLTVYLDGVLVLVFSEAFGDPLINKLSCLPKAFASPLKILFSASVLIN